jgi:hypothetical protein
MDIEILTKAKPDRGPGRRGMVSGVGVLMMVMLGVVVAVSWARCGKERTADRSPQTGKVPGGPSAALRQRVERLTGAPTRVVWARDMGKGKDTFANGKNLVLIGLDTREPGGERVLTEAKGNYSRPLFSPDGGSVYFSRRTVEGQKEEWRSDIFSVPWQGGDPQLLRGGYAVDVWQEPGKGRTWVYALTTLRPGIGANPEGTRLFRFPIDDPAREEVLWEHGLVSGDNLQLNRAGTMASGLIPWPNAGTFDFKSGTFIRYRNGCWPSLAPDDSGVVWVFDGTHKNLRFFLHGVEGNWRVPLDEAEGMKAKSAFHPRWSNHPQVICFTGPHPVKVNEGSGKVSVVLARLNPHLTGLEDTVNLRNASGEPDCYPDVWVAGGAEVSLDENQLGPERIREQSAAPAAADWQPPAEGLRFVWARADANNMIVAEDRACSVIARRYARFGPQFAMLTQGGTFEVDPVSAKAVRQALSGEAWSMELAVTPVAAGPEVPQVIFRAGSGLEIQQSKYDLILHTGGREWLVGAGLAVGKTTHLALGSAPPGEPPVVWLNGASQELRPLDVRASLPPRTGDEEDVRFGGRPDGSAGWAGRVETVAFNARPLDPALTAAHAAWWRERLGKETPPARTVVRARLKEASPRATPDSIKPYHRSWTSAVYEKTALISGPDPGAVFGVAHWTLLDDTQIEGPPGLPGTERVLTLEPMAGHPEMDSEHGSEEVLAEGQVLFLDMGPVGETP